MGLGYPTLNRYDPRSVAGLFDTNGYFSLVTGGDLAGDESHRVLVPYLDRPIYWLVNGRLDTWNPISFALLTVNSFFYCNNHPIPGKDQSPVYLRLRRRAFEWVCLSGELRDRELQSRGIRGFVNKLHVHPPSMDIAGETLVATAPMGYFGGPCQGDLCAACRSVCVRMVGYRVSANHA